MEEINTMYWRVMRRHRELREKAGEWLRVWFQAHGGVTRCERLDYLIRKIEAFEAQATNLMVDTGGHAPWEALSVYEAEVNRLEDFLANDPNT